MIVVPNKIAFQHLQKTGGTSITMLIKKKYPNQWLRIGKKHDVFQTKPKGSYSFVFGRNTYDRIASWWSMIKSPKHTGEWSSRVNKKASTFTEFVNKCIPDKRMADRGMYQLSRIYDPDGEKIVDRICRFENYSSEVIRVFKKAGKRIRLNDIPHELHHQRDHYSGLYTPKTRRLVANVFAEEIEYFDFEFEDMEDDF